MSAAVAWNEDIVTALFAPEPAIVPPPAVPATPERRLLLAVLDDAIACVHTTCGCKFRCDHRAAFLEAQRWFASNGDGVMTFRWVCDMLSMSPGAVRRAVREYGVHANTAD